MWSVKGADRGVARTQLFGGGGDGAGIISSDGRQRYERSRHGVMPNGARRSRMAFCVVIVRQACAPRSVFAKKSMLMRISVVGWSEGSPSNSNASRPSRLQSIEL